MALFTAFGWVNISISLLYWLALGNNRVYNPSIFQVMRKTVLSIYHKQKGEEGPPITFNFPEPETDGSVHLGRINDGGKGWQSTSLVVAGIGRLLCYRQYRLSRPVTFINEPSEPVVCLRLHIGKASTLGYQGEKKPLHLEFLDNRIFWQGDRITENHIMPHDYTLLELYYRPECLAHLADRTAVMDIIDQSLSEKNSPLDHYVFSGSKELDNFILDILHELDTMSISLERFHHLCDCLFLRCLGEKITVEPRPDLGEEQPENEGDILYEASPTEQKILAELEGTDRSELLKELDSLVSETNELKKVIKHKRALSTELLDTIQEIRRIPFKKLGDEYMRAAYFLAEWHPKKEIAAKHKKVIKRAIVSACKSAFELLFPTAEEMNFFMKWSGKPHASKPIEPDVMREILSLFLPPGAPELTATDGTVRSENLFLEQIREAFGFKSLSEIKGETAKNKPKEIVDLYETLMEHFSDTLELGVEGKITRSDIVRELDAAYHNDDLLTLLQIESESLATEPTYIAKQDDQRLRWLIVSLRLDLDDQRHIIQEFEENPEYEELQVFHRLGDNMEKFRNYIALRMKKFEPLGDNFSALVTDLMSSPSASKVISFAENILESKMER